MDTPNVSELEFYLVRNQDGKWLRTKGYGGVGECWTDDVKRAKVYGRIGPARAQVSFWANHYPKYGVPDIVKLEISGFTIINEADRIKKQAIKKKEAAK